MKKRAETKGGLRALLRNRRAVQTYEAGSSTVSMT